MSFGLERVGGKCLLAAEYDPEQEGKRQFTQDAYKILHPETPVTGDVFKIKAEEVPNHDVLSFTSPCQSFSLAGQRLGFNDIRGTVTFEALRIAKEKQPKVIFMENVKGLLSNDKGKTFEVILRAMCDVGYTIDFTILNSKNFNVPQNRERLFIVGVRNDLISQEDWAVEGSNVLAKTKKRLASIDDIKTFNFNWTTHTKSETKLRDILEVDVDEKLYLSEEKTTNLVGLLNENDVDDVPSVIHNIYGGFKENKPRIFKGTSPTIRTAAGGGHLPSVLQEVRPTLTPDREEKRQNGRRFKDNDEEAFTVTAVDRHGVTVGKKKEYKIRKLTPRETFRLQSFSDESFDRLAEAGFSDSRLYKFAGNAVTINVIESIGEKLVDLLEDIIR